MDARSSAPPSITFKIAAATSAGSAVGAIAPLTPSATSSVAAFSGPVDDHARSAARRGLDDDEAVALTLGRRREAGGTGQRGGDLVLRATTVRPNELAEAELLDQLEDSLRIGPVAVQLEPQVGPRSRALANPRTSASTRFSRT